jgi:16S rRNA (cytosine1402-N4)-methyltransferase
MANVVYHIPVMLAEAVALLDPRAKGIYVDATLGGGGYAEAVLAHVPIEKLYGFDTDPAAFDFATARLKNFGDKFEAVPENFAMLKEALAERGVSELDGIIYDLGVSSHQLDTDSVGLSYRIDALLDMRLDPRLPSSAADLVKDLSADELRHIFRQYGEEPLAGRIARRIVERRTLTPIATTLQLAAIAGEGIREDKKNSTLSRVFQALRIAVNSELENLERSLKEAVELLKPGGRIVVVSYHSLEDRIVKQLFQKASAPKAEPDSPTFFKESIDRSRAVLKLIGKQPLPPSAEEVERNARARSAKLRAAEKL